MSCPWLRFLREVEVSKSVVSCCETSENFPHIGARDVRVGARGDAEFLCRRTVADRDGPRV